MYEYFLKIGNLKYWACNLTLVAEGGPCRRNGAKKSQWIGKNHKRFWSKKGFIKQTCGSFRSTFVIGNYFWLFSFWIHETGHFLNKICRNKSPWTYHVPKNWVMTEKKMDIVARGFHGKWIKVKRFQKVAFIISPIQRDSREDRCLLVTSLPAHTNCHFSAISGLFWQSFPFFPLYLSQNWASDSYFEVLNSSKS